MIKNFKKGSLTVKILDINAEKERISLGIKHLKNDPVQDLSRSTQLIPKLLVKL